MLGMMRAGTLNLLVATAVAEEGLDLPACCLVLRFDLPVRCAPSLAWGLRTCVGWTLAAGGAPADWLCGKYREWPGPVCLLSAAV